MWEAGICRMEIPFRGRSCLSGYQSKKAEGFCSAGAAAFDTSFRGSAEVLCG